MNGQETPSGRVKVTVPVPAGRIWTPGARQLLDVIVAPLFLLLLVILRITPRRRAMELSGSVASILVRILPLRTFRRNLRAVLGTGIDEAALDQQCQEGLTHLIKTVVDIVKVLDQEETPLYDICQIEGEENLREALSRKKGVLLCSLHTGHWEIGGARIAAMGVPLSILYFEQISPLLDRYLNGLRQKHGVVLNHQRRGLKPSLRALARGEAVGIVADQDGTRNGVFTGMFGIPVSVPRGGPVFALRTGATVMISYNRRLPGNTYVQRFGAPIPFTPTGDARADEERLTRILVREFEAVIRDDPTQWLLAYDRFKLRHVARLKELSLYESSVAWQRALDEGASGGPYI